MGKGIGLKPMKLSKSLKDLCCNSAWSAHEMGLDGSPGSDQCPPVPIITICIRAGLCWPIATAVLVAELQ